MQRMILSRLLTLLLVSSPVAAQPAFTDPERGARLFATAPAPGLLACMDCHSEEPLVNNFGNIFVGRNAAALIQRAVVSNTGGMGYFRAYYDEAALADIAAYLGNSPAALDFGTVPLGRSSAPLSVTVNASSKQGLSNLAFTVDGPFELLGHDCGSDLAARRGCAVSLRFTPQAAGALQGTLQVAHSGLPAPARLRLSGQAIDRPPAVARVWPATLAGLRPGQPRSVLLGNDSPQPLTLGATRLPPGFDLAASSCTAGRVLPGGARCALAVVATASAAPGVPASLRVLHDGEGGGSDIGVTAAPPRPADGLRAVPAWADFGVRAADEEAPPLALWLHHQGAQAVRLQALAPRQGGFQQVGGSCQPGLLLQPGDRCSVQLRHVGAEPGPQHDEWLVHVQGQDTPAWRVPLLARRLLPGQAWPRLRPAALPALADGQVAEAWVLNAGAGPLQLQALQLDGAGAAAFAVLDGDTCRAGQRLQAGQRCRLLVQARPGSAALAAATLRVQHDASAPALRLPLQRAAAEPPVRPPPLVAGDAVVPPLLPTAAPVLRWVGQADPLLWAGTEPGAAPQARTLQLANAGAVALRLAALGLDGPHEADALLLATERDGADRCRPGLDLAPGATCRLVLAWHPGAPGLRQARLWVRAVPAADPTAAAVHAELAWRGQVAAPAAPWWVATPESVTLAVRRAGGSAGAPAVADEQTVRLHNAGAAVLVLDALQLQAPGFLRLPTVDVAGVAGAAETGDSGEVDCGVAPVALLPGQGCVARFGWTGQAQAAAGGRWLVQAAGEASTDAGAGLHEVPLALSESTATRSNVGAGQLGGASRVGQALMGLLAAGVLATLLHRAGWTGWRRPQARARPGHGPGSRP